LFCFRGYVASPVQDVGNCCDRDTSTLRYIFDPTRHLFTVPCGFLKHALDRAPRSMLPNLIVDVSGYRKRFRRAKSTIRKFPAPAVRFGGTRGRKHASWYLSVPRFG
jgi:hypothetical protein